MKQSLLIIFLLSLNIVVWGQSRQAVIDFKLDATSKFDFKSQKGTIKAAPNPFSDYILIKGIKNSYDVKVFDILGKEIFNFISSDISIGLSTNTYPSGIYLIELNPIDEELEKTVFKMVKL